MLHGNKNRNVEAKCFPEMENMHIEKYKFGNVYIYKNNIYIK